MTAEESNSSNICTTVEMDPQFRMLKEKYRMEADAYKKWMEMFISIENELDHFNENEEDASTRRRKAGVHKDFDFLGVSHKDAAEDLEDIYGEQKLSERNPNFRNFRKNDAISCLLDKKKYKGTIVLINQKGMIVKTKDRRKIRISWEDVDDEEIQITKLDSTE